MTCIVLEVPAPWAFMIRDFRTSAGEQTAISSSVKPPEARGTKMYW